MLGESVETSAGDLAETGKLRRVVGTNPFVVGSAAEEGITLLSILKRNPDIKCFILNTGTVGGAERGQKITVKDSVKMLEMIARDEIVWQQDKFWGYDIPVHIPGIDMTRFYLDNYYSKEQIQGISVDLKQERLSWLSRFERLDKTILRAIAP